MKKAQNRIVTDPNGSYTGRATDPFEKPVQDADDLELYQPNRRLG